jgi:hypothetical protein
VAIEASVGGAEPAKARISFARVDALTLTTSFDDAIRRSLRPGTAHQRYTRMWRMGRWQEEDGLILGRIGFQSPSTTELFNEEVSDFVEEAFTQGATSPFVIDPSSQRIVFQVRSGVIRPHSFTGALQALLNEASEFERWRVRPETYEVDWETWVNSVDRIAQLRIRLERPNPHYAERERVERLIEETNARIAELVLTAEQQGEGIDISDEFIVEAIEHARTYGRWSAEGERAGEPTMRWTSDETVATPERTIEADPTTHEARFEGMARELQQGEHAEGDQK